MPRFRISMALAVSVVMHAALLTFVLRAESRLPAHDAPREDPWAGDGLEVDAIREVPVTEATEEPRETTPPPAPVQPPASEPREPEPPREAPPLDETPAAAPARIAPRVAISGGPLATAERAPAPSPPPKAPAAPTTATSTSPTAGVPSPATSSATASTPAESGAGVFGSIGLPPGVRHLALAFARALPKGAYADSAFRELPPGKLGEARIRLRVDEEGKLGPLEFVDERARDTLPPPIVRMLDNALRLLAVGRFSLSNQRLEPGVLALRVRVELGDEAPSVAENAQPHHVRELKGPASAGENPKRAWFILNSGRRVDAWIQEE